jgi:predicted RNA binding protein YcfA (HicA-like mRNA interferase family)
VTRLPRVRGGEVIAALQRGGFRLTHIRGSHHYLRKPEMAGLVVVPVHGGRDLPIGTLHSILRQAGLSVEEFVRLLEGP